MGRRQRPLLEPQGVAVGGGVQGLAFAVVAVVRIDSFFFGISINPQIGRQEAAQVVALHELPIAEEIDLRDFSRVQSPSHLFLVIPGISDSLVHCLGRVGRQFRRIEGQSGTDAKGGEAREFLLFRGMGRAELEQEVEVREQS